MKRNMQKEYKTLGIVLAAKKWRENDLFFSIYTKENGLVEAIAVGAKKIKSKLNGHLSLSGIVEIVYVKGKAFYKLTHATIVDRWPLNTIEDFSYFSAISEVLLKTVEREHPNKQIWQAIIWSAEKIFINNEQLEKKKFIFNLLLIKILDEAGYKLKTDSCVICEKEIGEAKGFDFSYPGFICQDCMRGQQFSPKIFDLIKKLQTEEVIKELKISKQSNQQLFDLLRKYLVYSFEKRLYSLEALN